MKAFRFRLEPLLQLREAARDACRAKLARVLAEQHRLLAEQNAVECSLHEQHQQARVLMQSATLTLEGLRQIETCRARLTTELAQLLLALQAAETAIADCQRHLVAAESAFQTVAKLRDRQASEHAVQFARCEAKLADEAAARRFRHAA